MPPRLNRAAITLEVGESLRDLAKRLAKLGEYSGDARDKELRSINLSLAPLSSQLQRVIDNCRAIGGSYPNYPAVRKAVLQGGDRVYDLRSQLDALRVRTDWAEDPSSTAALARIGQELKLVQFAPPLTSEPEAVPNLSTNG